MSAFPGSRRFNLKRRTLLQIVLGAAVLVSIPIWLASQVIADAGQAAELAARLANEKCKRFWQREPFRPEQYVARFQNGRWYWGEYDPAGVDGFSPEVSFTSNGGDAKTRVNFSTDIEDWGQTEEDQPAERGPCDEAEED